MRRRLVALGALLTGVSAGLAFLRRTANRRRERVDLFYENGSLVTLVDDEAVELLDIARSALDATRA
jgi:hypothetical protein